METISCTECTGRDKCRECQRWSWRCWRYRLTPEQIWSIFREQEGKCLLCSRTFGHPLDMDFDHDHRCCKQTKKNRSAQTCGACLRGLLCTRCNVDLGKAEGRGVEWLVKASEYVTTRA